MTGLRQLTLNLQDPEEPPRLPEDHEEVIEAMAALLLAVLVVEGEKEVDGDGQTT